MSIRHYFWCFFDTIAEEATNKGSNMPPQNQTTDPVPQNNDNHSEPINHETGSSSEVHSPRSTIPKKQQRINRLSFFVSYIVTFIIPFILMFLFSILLSMIDSLESDVRLSMIGFPILCVVIVYLVLVSLRSAVFRCRDIGVSPWFILLLLIPLVGLATLIYLMIKPGQPGANDHGDPPSGINLKRIFLFAKA